MSTKIEITLKQPSFVTNEGLKFAKHEVEVEGKPAYVVVVKSDDVTPAQLTALKGQLRRFLGIEGEAKIALLACGEDEDVELHEVRA